jgi:hypothetical protein
MLILHRLDRGRQIAEGAAGPRVCRLTAGGKRIRTLGPAEDARRPGRCRFTFAPTISRWREISGGDMRRSWTLVVSRGSIMRPSMLT